MAMNDDLNVLMNTVAEAVDYSLFIRLAGTVVDENLADQEDLSVQTKSDIQLYLAAHFATLSTQNGGVVREQIGQSAKTYRSIDSKYLGFRTTTFGQMALALDTTGILVALGSGSLKAEFRVV